LTACPNCGAENQSEATFCIACGSSLEPVAANLADVKKCSYCAKPLAGEDAYYFRCRYCAQDFCYEHRLPENHLCKSSPLRRNIPSGSSAPYYSTGGGYYSRSDSSPRSAGGFTINISKQGKNLAIAIVAGLIIGAITNFIQINGLPAVYYLVQYNALVLSGWILPILTSMIVVLPGLQGLLDVAFNAFAVVWLDSLLRSFYTPRQYYGIFILTGVAGNLLSLILYSPNTISFGASGGIFGLIAGCVTIDYARNRRLNSSLVIWFIFIFFISTFTGGVDVFAHLGGALVGLAAGYYVGSRGRSFRGWS